MKPVLFFAVAACLTLAHASMTQAQSAAPVRPLLPIDFVHSAEFRWLQKPVHASRTLDDMSDSSRWAFSGTGAISFPTAPQLGDMRVLRVDMRIFRDAPAPTRSKFSQVNLRVGWSHKFTENMKLSLFVEGFNIFNTANFGNSFDGTVGSPNFKKPINFFGATGFSEPIGIPFQGQFGFRFSF